MEKLYAIRVFWGVGFVLFLSVLVNVWFLFRYVWHQKNHTRAFIKKTLLAVVPVIFLFFAFEFYFAYRYVKTDISNSTYASQLWFKRYWYPFNGFRYRDTKNKDLEGKKIAYFVGDSFAAGYGIENVEDRFSNRVASALGEEWEHILIAKPGWNTEQEYTSMAAYPANPDRIVLSYYVNDIVDDGKEVGRPPPQTLRNPGKVTGFLSRNSFFLNWVYWRTAYLFVGTKYQNYLENCYMDNEIWNRHAAKLAGFVQYAERYDAELLVVVWPGLRRIEETAGFTRKVCDFFEENGIPTVDMAEHLKGIPPKKLIVNFQDSHPNAHTHGLAADLILKKLEASNAQ